MQTIHDEKEQQGGENQDLTKKKAKRAKMLYYIKMKT
jgi:hypothetical protein